jgi:hypothetical protein
MPFRTDRGRRPADPDALLNGKPRARARRCRQHRKNLHFRRARDTRRHSRLTTDLSADYEIEIGARRELQI